jgi:hypothetical protein
LGKTLLQPLILSHYEKTRSPAARFSLSSGLLAAERRLSSEIRQQGMPVQLDLGEVLAARARLF